MQLAHIHRVKFNKKNKVFILVKVLSSLIKLFTLAHIQKKISNIPFFKKKRRD